MTNTFHLYCKDLTDTQLENVLKKEWDASQYAESRVADYAGAVLEAAQRGWYVVAGERIG